MAPASGTVYTGAGQENSSADTDYSTYYKIKHALERKQNRPGKQAGRDSGRTGTEFKGEACRIWNR